MPYWNRRALLMKSGAAAIASSAAWPSLSLAREERQGVTFSFGTYGMRSLTTEEAVRAIADTGYDGVELATRPEWDSAPSRLLAPRRKRVRKLMSDHGLQLTALMMNLRPSNNDAEHAKQLEQLKRIIQLGRDLAGEEMPVVQTILGGGKWEEKKHLLLRRVADWVKVAQQQKTVVCIKPHRGGVMSRPSEAVWMIRQLNETPWLRLVYDYSHYAFRNMTIEATVKTALSYTGHIAVKDTIRKGDGTTFVLPGESGTFDYSRLFKLFYDGGYRGDICCEVSSAVWRQPGYDPLAAAKTCYRNIAPVLKQAGIPRR